MSSDVQKARTSGAVPLDQTIEPARSGGPPAEASDISRRQFLEAAGFTISLAAMSGCYRAPVEHALPLPVQPAGAISGGLRYYASTCGGCSAICGMLVGVRDGRPLKMEGMPEHPLSYGGLCAVGQALPLGLYDSHRLQGPLLDGKPATWSDVDQRIVVALKKIKEENRAVRLVTSTITSPTLQATIDLFLSQFADGRHVVMDPVSSSAILDAHERTHGVRVLPRYRFDQAAVVASFGADFLGTWISPVEFTSSWRQRRSPTETNPRMSYHVQFESRMSLTGAAADLRVRIRPEDQGPLLARLAENITTLVNGASSGAVLLKNSPETDKLLSQHETTLIRLAQRLSATRGESLVVSDSQDVEVQIIVNYINDLLANYGKTLDVEFASLQRQGNDGDVSQLLDELASGQVGALLVAGADLSHNLPNREAMADAVARVPLVISFAERVDDFASLAGFVCPDHHPLESWSDAQPVPGVVSLAQPTIRPLGDTRSILESLVLWSGRRTGALALVRSHWRESVFPKRLAESPREFTQFWDQSLHDGFVRVNEDPIPAKPFQTDVVKAIESRPAPSDFSLVLYTKVAMPDSRHAHNAWLQELPDPVTKVVWDNYVCVSPKTAEEMGLTTGDVVRVSAGKGGPELELPALVQPGQHDRVLAVALGYGARGTDRFAKIGPQWFESRPTVPEGQLLGTNAAPLIEMRDATLQYSRSGVTLTKTGGRRDLAVTQLHHSQDVPANVAPRGAEYRDIVQQTTLQQFAKDPHHAGVPPHHHDSKTQLWPEDHPMTGPHWGMVIDLNACTGCSACVIACQAENNIPVVGKDEVRRQREMYWLRIDRYYSGQDDHVQVAHQPMMCQHCDNAPCETVCPVLATVHSEEGLNEQVYNRCVGTRYCANNCPYKVRRFNWFAYPHDDSLQNLALNPDVTVRSRGVMEKCSMCVQRIEAGKIEARSQDAPLQDGAVLTACQQSCPAQAIVFGDMNDPESQVRAALNDPRRFRVLEELNVRPSVAYLRIVKNLEHEDDESQPGGPLKRNNGKYGDGEPKHG